MARLSNQSNNLYNKINPDIFDIHFSDARNIKKYLEQYTKITEYINVTITSPPYHNLINYGKNQNQIGYGQKYNDYLRDLSLLFGDIYDLTRKDGSLWIIVDTFSKNKSLKLLPFNLTEKIIENNWILKDIIIWKKDKTRPWNRKGQMRKIFEYILFFVKSEDYKFYEDRIRVINTDKFKEWWVKYPERYNPKGILPTNIWEYSIPVQGEWGKNGLKHSNPLPLELINRILLLTTDINDIVLDPFSGSGMVSAVSKKMGRNYIGLDINQNYIDNFDNTYSYVNKSLIKNDDQIKIQNSLSNLIINLRLIKYGKTLIKEIIKNDIKLLNDVNEINSILIYKNNSSTDIKNRKIVGKGTYYLIFNNEDSYKNINLALPEIIHNNRELIRYQIDPDIICVPYKKFYDENNNSKKDLFLYAKANTHKYVKKISINEWYDYVNENNDEWKNYYFEYMPPIISNLKINVDIKKTWYSKNKKYNIERVKIIDLLKLEDELN